MSEETDRETFKMLISKDDEIERLETELERWKAEAARLFAENATLRGLAGSVTVNAPPTNTLIRVSREEGEKR